MRYTVLIGLLMMLIHTTSLAEEITTNNLVTNGNFETGNANGWTTSGDVQVLNDCCELNGVTSTKDLEFGDSGYIEQDFNFSSDTIKDPTGAPRPFDKQQEILLAYFPNSFNDILRAIDALKIRAPSICNFILFSFNTFFTDLV